MVALTPITCPPAPPVGDCGPAVNSPCFTETVDVGLGPGKQWLITSQWITPPTSQWVAPSIWVFVEGRDPVELGNFGNGATYVITWDFRKSFRDGLVKLGLYFVPTAADQARGVVPYWMYTNGPGVVTAYTHDCLTFTFTDTWTGDSPNPYQELAVVDPSETCTVQFREFGISIFDCCPPDCTRPYDNNVFATRWYHEVPFSVNDLSNPGLAKQVFLAQQGGIMPTRALALTRSADAHDENYRLQYGSQKWVMVWDLELDRLIDFFPKQWLRYGAAFYFQNQTLRKHVRAGKTNRVPYYVEEVDLGLVFNAQGSFNFDRDIFGQHTTNWDVPSKLIGMPQERQQPGIHGWGLPDAMGVQALYAEFNQQSIDAFQSTLPAAIVAQREKFFKDRELFLEHTAKQRFHDQIMFLTREVAEKTLRLMEDNVEQLKYLVDSFNPEVDQSFAYYSVILLNAISNKLLRTNEDVQEGVLKGTGLGPNELSHGEWIRECYGELRRLVELTRIQQQDVQLKILQAVSGANPANPQSALSALASAINFPAVAQEMQIAAEGIITPAAGVTNPDIASDNQLNGIT